ncbi:S24 family peptidase [Empedobacter falsenii]
MKEKENTIIYSNQITERLNSVVDYIMYKYKIKTKTALAKSLEIPQPNLSAALNGTEKYQTEGFFKKISEKYNEINHNWILTAENSMLNNSNESTETEVIPKIKTEIPYYNVDFSGGWKSEDLFSTHQPSFFITNPEFTRAEFACNLIGNSISRRIPHNAIIGLKEIKEWKVYFPTNEIYAVVMKNELRTVKIVKRSANKDFLILIPDPLDIYNQTGYEPEEVPIDFIEKFFQVVAWGQFEKLAM